MSPQGSQSLIQTKIAFNPKATSNSRKASNGFSSVLHKFRLAFRIFCSIKQSLLDKVDVRDEAGALEVLGAFLESTSHTFHGDLNCVLHQVAAKEMPQLTSMLIDRGANVNHQGPARRKMVSFNGHTLFENFKSSIIRQAMRSDATLRCILERQADPNAKLLSSKGDYITALHEAAALGLCSAIQLLVVHGAEVDYKSYYGTPLMFALAKGHINAARLLIGLGADVNYSLDPSNRYPGFVHCPVEASLLDCLLDGPLLLFGHGAIAMARNILIVEKLFKKTSDGLPGIFGLKWKYEMTAEYKLEITALLLQNLRQK